MTDRSLNMTDRSCLCYGATVEVVETSAGPLAYDSRGAGGTVVMLPSGAHRRGDFDELRALVPGRFRTIALDWPGHGDSPSGAGEHSAMSFADVAEEAVAALAPEGAVVLGNSVGGFAAGRLAVRRPELVRGLVVVDGGGFDGNPPQARVFCALMARPWFLRRIYPAFSSFYMRSRTDADRRAREGALETVASSEGCAVVNGLWRSFASPEHDLRDGAAAIAAPTLAVWGRRDPVIPLRVGRRAAASIPGARLVELDTGHVPHTSDPEGFAAELVPFLDEVFATAPVSP
jgi:pimeloyl-ACP methyl ester carboxylesterase